MLQSVTPVLQLQEMARLCSQAESHPSQSLFYPGLREAHVHNALDHGWVRLGIWPDDSRCPGEH